MAANWTEKAPGSSRERQSILEVKPPEFLQEFMHWLRAGFTENQARRANVIKKMKGGYKVLSENEKNLGGPYKSKAEAEKRLRQVEFFKHRKS
jgi:hypothetical protein